MRKMQKKREEKAQRAEAAKKKREEMKKMVEEEEAKKLEAKELERKKRFERVDIKSPDVTTLVIESKPIGVGIGVVGSEGGATAHTIVAPISVTTNLSMARRSREITSTATCTAADVMCPWTGTETGVQPHTATCHYVALKPVLSSLIKQNQELTAKLQELQQQYQDLKQK